MVWGLFKHVTFIVHLISIIITSALFQIIYQALDLRGWGPLV